jgi:hypothetical protein
MNKIFKQEIVCEMFFSSNVLTCDHVIVIELSLWTFLNLLRHRVRTVPHANHTLFSIKVQKLMDDHMITGYISSH